ncbi:MAG: ABC transporter substrate-binding protein, partial [Kurthia sp.]
MKNRHKFSTVLLIALFMLVGCNTTKETSNNNGHVETTQEIKQYPMKIQDATGENIEIEREPNKIVSLIPNNTETLFALGVDKKVVGVSDSDNYPKAVTNIEKIGGMEFNIEKIISLKPDVVLAHSTMAESAKTGM